MKRGTVAQTVTMGVAVVLAVLGSLGTAAASAALPDRAAPAGRRLGEADLEAVATGGGARLVAGSSLASGAALWRSTGGGTWQRVATGAFGDARAVTAMAWDGRRFVAADDGGRWWASRDGRSWSVAGEALPAVAVTGVVRWRGRTVAIGDRRGEPEAATRGVILAADRLRDWRRLAAFRFREGTLSAVAVHRDELWVTGFDVDGARVWRTTHGRRWRREARLPGAALQGLASVDGRLLGVGAAISDPLRPLRWIAGEHGWRSRQFRRGGRSGETQVVAVTRVGDAALAVGSDAHGGVVWRSPDGDRWRVAGR